MSNLEVSGKPNDLYEPNQLDNLDRSDQLDNLVGSGRPNDINWPINTNGLDNPDVSGEHNNLSGPSWANDPDELGRVGSTNLTDTTSPYGPSC